MTKLEALITRLEELLRENHAFADVAAGTVLTPEVTRALWAEHEKLGRKLTMSESAEVVKRLKTK
jgi:hypothetical protein